MIPQQDLKFALSTINYVLGDKKLVQLQIDDQEIVIKREDSKTIKIEIKERR